MNKKLALTEAERESLNKAIRKLMYPLVIDENSPFESKVTLTFHVKRNNTIGDYPDCNIEHLGISFKGSLI